MTRPREQHTLLLMFAAAFFGLLWLIFAVREARQAVNAEACGDLLEKAQGTGLAEDYAAAERLCGSIY